MLCELTPCYAVLRDGFLATLKAVMSGGAATQRKADPYGPCDRAQQATHTDAY